MAITALVPWFGSKRNLAPAIIDELGPHDDYWELFCGSMAITLMKPEARNETVNDLHGDLHNLARVLQDERVAPVLYRRLRRTLFSEDIHRDCQQRLKAGNIEAIDRAYCYFVKSWMGMSGIAGTKRAESKLCIRYTSTGGSPSVRFSNAVASIPAWVKRLRRIRILNRCGIKLAENIPDVPGVAVYADPPYLVKGSEYQHDFTADDHKRLAAALGTFRKARVVVSYYEHPQLESLYPGWTKVELDARKAMVCQSARDMKGVDAPAPEVLLLNGRSFAKASSQRSLFNPTP